MRYIISTLAIAWACISSALAQETIAVEGRVTDAKHQPIGGVAVVVKGTNVGTATNEKGGYHLRNVPVGKQTFVFSCIGFKDYIIEVEAEPSKAPIVINAQLEAETTALQEVEVIGRKERTYKNTNSFVGTKTASALKDVPQSIGYVTKELILDQGATTVNEVVKNISGVNQYTTYNDFSIRGFRATGNRGSGNLVNGMRSQSSLWRQSSLANIERVEVIKGPASALYGNAAPGGIINRVTKKPLLERRNSVSISAGSWNALKTYGDFTGPLNEKKTMLYRLNLGYEKTDTFRDLQGYDNYIVAPSFSYIPNEKTSLNVDFVYQYFNGKVDRGQPFPYGGSLYDTPISMSMSAANDFLKEKQLNTTIGFTHHFTDNISLNATYLNSSYDEDLQEHLQANAYYKQIGNNFRYADPNKVLMNATLRKRYYVNNSINAYMNFNFNTAGVKHKLLVGYDYFNSEYKHGSNITAQGYVNKNGTSTSGTYTTTANVLAGSVQTPTTNVPVFDMLNPAEGNAYKNISKYIFKANALAPYEEYSHAIYAQDQLGYDIFKLLIGVRQEYYTEILNKGVTTGKNKEAKAETKAFIPRIGLVIAASDNINLYSTWVKGFQPQSSNIQAEPDRYGGPFDYEKSELYEIGLKTEWFRRRLSATISVYRILQENSLEASARPNLPDWRIPVDMRSEGVEIDVAGRIFPHWSIIANYAYTDARITKLKEPGDLRDVNIQRPSTPFHAANFWTKYIIPKGALKDLGVGVGVNYVSERLGQVGRRATATTYPDYTLVNAVLYYRVSDVQLQLNVNNVLNRTYWISGYDNLRNFPGAPRHINATVTYQF